MTHSQRICKVEGCDRVNWAHSVCSVHLKHLGKGVAIEDMKPIRKQRNTAVVVTCEFDACERTAYKAQPYCNAHYQQIRRGIELKPLRMSNKGKSCTFEGCGRSAAKKSLCNAHFDQMRRTGTLLPIHHRRVREGWTRNSSGYITRQIDGISYYQHRVAMEEHLGRPLLKHENIHHVNGDRADNRIENLEIWNTHQPSGQRVEDKADWAEEILRLYRPQSLAPGLRIVAA